MKQLPNVFGLLLLAIFWLVMAFMIGPAGEFPLNDDWSYTWSVQALVEQGTLQFTGWVSMPLVAQVIWASLFSLVDGFSFTATRVSSIVMGAWAIAATFILLRLVGAGLMFSLLGALVLLANPVFVNLSYTFMTDVPFTAMFVTSAALLVCGLRRESAGLILAGLVFAICALFIRQLGLAIFIAFFFGYLARNGPSPKRIAWATSVVLLGFGLYVSYGILLDYLGKTPFLYSVKNAEMLTNIVSVSNVKRMAVNGLSILINVGVFLFPLVFLCSRRGTYALWARGLPIVFGGAIAGVLVMSDRLFPLSGNILFDVGCGPPQLSVGPVTLKDTFLLCMNSTPVLPPWLQIMFLFLGAVAGVLVLQSIAVFCGRVLKAGVRRFLQEEWEVVFLGSLVLVYLAPVLIGNMIDRYSLPILPILMAIFYMCERTWHAAGLRAQIAGGLIAVFAVFSTMATHDYLAWNAARWNALTTLEQEFAASSAQIDGGFEYNGWHNYSPTHQGPDGASWWWVDDDRYIISFNPLEGYTQIRSVAFEPWIPGSLREILILRRTDG